MQQLGFSQSVKTARKYSIDIAESFLVKTHEELSKCLKKIKYPAVIKVFSSQIIHKSKEGFVRTGIKNESELLENFKELSKHAQNRKISDFIFVIQEETQGKEFIVGGKTDSVFGPCVIFGLGGIYTEILKKTTLRICPVSGKDAKDMVEEIAGGILSEREIRTISTLIVRAAKMISSENIPEMDLNPVIVSKDAIHVPDIRIIK